MRNKHITNSISSTVRVPNISVVFHDPERDELFDAIIPQE